METKIEFTNRMVELGIVKLQPIMDEDGTELGAVQIIIDREQYDIEHEKYLDNLFVYVK